MTKVLNEFRQDLVSGEWVLLATGRSKKSVASRKSVEEAYQDKEKCPFEDLQESGQIVLWTYPDEKNWEVAVIKNKFPAVSQGLCGPESTYGPFKIQNAAGSHDVVVYRDHDRSIYDFSISNFINMSRVYKKRFTELAEKADCMKYILIFHNHGSEAGASLYHPHSQIITTPILPPDVFHSVSGSFRYYKEHKKRVYSELLEWEQKERKRIVYENKEFIVFCPYVSKYPYEMRIFSKESHAHFNQMPDNSDEFFADALYTAIQKMKTVLGKPPFNMFIHTAPLTDEFGVNTHEYYHWHTEIVPHLKIDAGFEIGTGIEINVVDPDEAAELLRGARI